MKSNRNPLSRLLFLAYCVIMLWLLFGQRWKPELAFDSENINLIPFYSIRYFIHLLQLDEYRKHAIINLFGNVIVFIPLGYLLPKIWARYRGIFKTIIAVSLMIVIVELLQYATGLGSLDVDDYILNIFGTLIGYIVWKIKSA